MAGDDFPASSMADRYVLARSVVQALGAAGAGPPGQMTILAMAIAIVFRRDAKDGVTVDDVLVMMRGVLEAAMVDRDAPLPGDE